MNLTLEPIDRDNFDAVVNLAVKPEQIRYVAPNVMTLAACHVYTYVIPIAVCVDGELVGFAAWGRNPESGRMFIFRLMIGQHHQGRGYGRQAVRELVKVIRAPHHADDIYLSLVPADNAARKLYESLGFVHTGEVDEDGELVFRLAASAQTP